MTDDTARLWLERLVGILDNQRLLTTRGTVRLELSELYAGEILVAAQWAAEALGRRYPVIETKPLLRQTNGRTNNGHG